MDTTFRSSGSFSSGFWIPKRVTWFLWVFIRRKSQCSSWGIAGDKRTSSLGRLPWGVSDRISPCKFASKRTRRIQESRRRKPKGNVPGRVYHKSTRIAMKEGDMNAKSPNGRGKWREMPKEKGLLEFWSTGPGFQESGGARSFLRWRRGQFRTNGGIASWKKGPLGFCKRQMQFSWIVPALEARDRSNNQKKIKFYFWSNIFQKESGNLAGPHLKRNLEFEDHPWTETTKWGQWESTEEKWRGKRNI